MFGLAAAEILLHFSPKSLNSTLKRRWLSRSWSMKFKVGDHVKASARLREACGMRLILRAETYEFAARGGVVTRVHSSAGIDRIFVRINGGVYSYDLDMHSALCVLDVASTLLDGVICCD
jgi:hypothetical protein